MTIDLKTVMDFANTVTVVALLVLILIGGYRMWWVFGWAYRDAIKDRDEWKAIALKGAHLAERALETPAPINR